MQKITTFLMFAGQAEEAMSFYTTIYKNSEIKSLTRYGPGEEAGVEGSVMHATFTLNGKLFLCIDSNVEHEFTFTPAMSLYVTCDTEAEIDELFEKLSHEGKVHMPLAAYPFSKKFAWIDDRFGVSWQLNLADVL